METRLFYLTYLILRCYRETDQRNTGGETGGRPEASSPARRSIEEIRIRQRIQLILHRAIQHNKTKGSFIIIILLLALFVLFFIKNTKQSINTRPNYTTTASSLTLILSKQHRPIKIHHSGTLALSQD